MAKRSIRKRRPGRLATIELTRSSPPSVISGSQRQTNAPITKAKNKRGHTPWREIFL